MSQHEPTLGEMGEAGLLEGVFQTFSRLPKGQVLIGPGDDTAYLQVRSQAVLATTDTMVRGSDWLDEWSSGFDVGAKAVTQNLADLAAMGGVGTGLLVTLIADPALPAAWAQEMTKGLAWAAERAGVPVIGGDLSSAPTGMVAVSITALGELAPGVRHPVLRSGACPGDVLAVSGELGRSGAGWWLLESGISPSQTQDPDLATGLITYHQRPLTDLSQGPIAALAGATSMIDISDGLVRDADRIARASGVHIILDPSAIRALADGLTPVLDDARAQHLVLSGGEEHELLATFPLEASLPAGWIRLGTVNGTGEVHEEAAIEEVVTQEAVIREDQADPDVGVWLEGIRLDPRAGGWDHFGG